MVDIFIDHQPHQVFTRSSWSGDWTVRHYLYANSVRWAAKPTMDEAELEYRYGDIMRPNTAFFAKGNPLSIDGHYVKIVIEQGEGRDDLTWYGVLVERSDELRGSDGTSPSGRTHYTAYGLEYLLSKSPITRSFYRREDDGESFVDRAIGFNTAVRDAYDGDSRASAGTTRQGNMSEAPGFNVAPVFRKAGEDGTTWSAANIIEYLLSYHAPVNADGNEAIRFVLDYDSAIDHLTWGTPVVEVRRHAVLDILNELCDRRRLTSWRLVVESDDTVSVVIFTFNASAISLPDGSTIPANDSTVTWNFDSQVEIASAVLMQDRSAKFDYVLVRGERRTSTFTVSTYTSKIEKDWETADETAYITGAGVGADRNAKQERNRLYRLTDRFKRVYSYFKIPKSWTGTDYAGTVVCPTLDASGNVTAISEKFWYPGLRLTARLPLQHDIDYSGTNIADDNLVDTAPAGSLPEYRAPLILIKTEGSRYRQIEHLSAESNDDSAGKFYGWSAGVRMQDEALGFVLDVRGDAPQHIIAGPAFTGADADDLADFSSSESLNYADDISATVCIEFDSYCQGVWPTGSPLESTDTLRSLLIEVPNARLDYVVPGTVVAVNASGTLTTNSSGGFITDDRERVENIARMAYEWYSATRYALHVSVNDLVCDFSIGQLITTIEHGTLTRTINSVITDISLDLVQGTSSVKTQFGQLDFGGL